MSYGEFLEFRMVGKILAKLLTALIFGSFDQAKEHILLKSMLFMGLRTFSSSPEYTDSAARNGVISVDYCIYCKLS